MRASTLAFTAATALVSVSDAASVDAWKSRSIYQVMIDRFARTDGSTTAPCDKLYLFCNGTWSGLIDHLDYIQDMGFTAVQISPVVHNIENDTSVGEAYHGYYPDDLYAINEHFGTADELVKLSNELHNRDMYLLVDVVVNDMAQAFNNTIPPPVDYSLLNPFNNKDYYHPYCNVTEWDNATNYQDCWLYPYGVALADLDTESDTVVDMFGKWIKELISNYTIDGVRIDAAKHVNDGFLPKFVDNAGVFALGEVLTGVVDDFCPYQTQGYLPGMPNYLEYYPIIQVFNGGSMTTLADMREEARASCSDTLALGSFAENHDMPLYQGQEQHFSGGETPANREALWLSGYNTSAELYVTAKTLNKVRNTMISLSNSSSTTYIDSQAQTLFSNTNHLCQVKGPEGYQVVSCVVNYSSTGSSYKLSVGGFSAGDAVVEVLGCTTSTADDSGNVTMYMDKGEPKAYILQSVLNQTGLCNTTQDAATAAKKDAAVGVRSSLAIVFGVAVASVMMVL
ncbi:Alpha-amylase 2 [Cytospora mali]|uniref:alpha-amylase n=1 Tax=Cytospora mali TaxID=578113 RepID=A0A194UML5_CYTMA|nr:Alpha-amylase 2 [Valsa mali var. pyri (nom. inval.)]